MRSSSHLVRAALLAALAIAGTARAQDAPTATAAHDFRGEIDRLVARPGGLTADVVARRAVDTSFAVRASAEQAIAAAETVHQTIVGYFPRLTLQGGYTRFSNSPEASLGNVVVAPGAAPGPLAPGTPLANAPVTIESLDHQSSVSAVLSIPVLDYLLRIPGAHEAAAEAREAADLAQGAALLQVATDAKVAYYGWARARLAVAIAERTLELTRQHRKDAESGLAAGSASSADVLQSDARVAGAEVALAQARAGAATALDVLRTVVHAGTGDVQFEIGEDLRQALAPVSLTGTGSLIEEAWTVRLEIRAFEASGRSARAQASVARADYLPAVDVYGSWTAADPNPRYLPARDRYDDTWAAGVELRWSFNQAASAHFAASAADARARSVDAQVYELRDRLRAEVVRAVEGVREADVAVASADRGLAAAEESYRVRAELFASGRATSVELSDAETSLTRARLEDIDVRIQQRVARIQLEHALGRDVRTQE